MKEIRLRLPLLSLLLASSLLAASAQQTPIQIHADLTNTPRKLFHADVDIPVHPGPLDLITPEWIPGAHGPDGPIHDITGIRFEVDGKTISWHRDPINTYEYHVDIPSGASLLHAHLDCIYSRATRTTATLEWEPLMLYPPHTPPPRRRHDSIRTHPRRDARRLSHSHRPLLPRVRPRPRHLAPALYGR